MTLDLEANKFVLFLLWCMWYDLCVCVCVCAPLWYPMCSAGVALVESRVSYAAALLFICV